MKFKMILRRSYYEMEKEIVIDMAPSMNNEIFGWLAAGVSVTLEPIQETTESGDDDDF